VADILNSANALGLKYLGLTLLTPLMHLDCGSQKRYIGKKRYNESEDYGVFNFSRQYTDKSGAIHKKHNGMLLTKLMHYYG
jgi:hypothetical protein